MPPQWFHEAEEGRWTASALRLQPRAPGAWTGEGMRPRAYVCEGRVVATVRRAGAAGGMWLARIEGFEWAVTPGMGIARFAGISGGASLTHTAVKGFKGISEARAAVARVMAAMPPAPAHEDPGPEQDRSRGMGP